MTRISIQYMPASELHVQLARISRRYPNLNSLSLSKTNIHQLTSFNHLESFRRLDELTIDEHEPICSLCPWWRLYVVFRLSHTGMAVINGKTISVAEQHKAEALFSPIASCFRNVCVHPVLCLLLSFLSLFRCLSRCCVYMYVSICMLCRRRLCSLRRA